MKSVFLALCLASSFLSAQNITIQVDGQDRGTEGILNLVSGNGVFQSCREEAAKHRITCEPSMNTARIPTHDSIHENENFCQSSNGTRDYTCALPQKAIDDYKAGMSFVLVADTACDPSCTLQIVRKRPPVRITLSDGSTEPHGSLAAGEPQWIFYDGSVFRLMGGGRGGPRAGDASGSERDVRGRRLIASMETIPYASSLTLETTAGDMHKTTTNNAIGNATIRAATGGLSGQHMWVIIVNDQLSPKTITFGEHLRSAGPLTGIPGKAATLQFISDGEVWYEVARSTNL